MEIPEPKEGEEEETEESRDAAARAVNLSAEREKHDVVNAEEEEEEQEEEDGEIVEAAEEGEEQWRQQQEVRRTADEARELRALKARPSVLVVGPPAVGKRSLVSRLAAKGRSSKVTSETGSTVHGWTIDTKYYTANVSMWMARFGHPALADTAKINSEFGRCEALIMVFDLSSPTSFEQLQEWAKGLDLENFEIRLCIGNKADRVPEHFAHTEYRRKLQKKGESSSDPHPEFWDFGINRAEGSSFLDEDEVSAEDRRRTCIEWCSETGVEYIEACAIDEVFDECMTVDGDLQGVARIHGALTAHMWPGLVMKNGSEGDDEAHQEQEITSEDDSDYYVEYELLSNGSAEPWEGFGWEEQWSSADVDEPAPESSSGGGSHSVSGAQPKLQSEDSQHDDKAVTPVAAASEKSAPVPAVAEIPQSQTSVVEIPPDEHVDHPAQSGSGEKEGLRRDGPKPSGKKNDEWEDMEKLMTEMSSMRTNMRSMSDQHRREMAGRLALRMASMFKDNEDESDLE